jgi:hypothetical protein
VVEVVENLSQELEMRVSVVLVVVAMERLGMSQVKMELLTQVVEQVVVVRMMVLETLLVAMVVLV